MRLLLSALYNLLKFECLQIVERLALRIKLFTAVILYFSKLGFLPVVTVILFHPSLTFADKAGAYLDIKLELKWLTDDRDEHEGMELFATVKRFVAKAGEVNPINRFFANYLHFTVIYTFSSALKWSSLEKRLSKFISKSFIWMIIEVWKEIIEWINKKFS